MFIHVSEQHLIMRIAQLYQLFPVDTHTVVHNQCMRKEFDSNHLFVVALCYVPKCELSCNVLGMTQNCIHTECIIVQGV